MPLRTTNRASLLKAKADRLLMARFFLARQSSNPHRLVPIRAAPIRERRQPDPVLAPQRQALLNNLPPAAVRPLNLCRPENQRPPLWLSLLPNQL